MQGIMDHSVAPAHRPLTRVRVGVVRESSVGERRVALVPKAVMSLIGKGVDVVVEPGAGAEALIPDELYVEAGATIGLLTGSVASCEGESGDSDFPRNQRGA